MNKGVWVDRGVRGSCRKRGAVGKEGPHLPDEGLKAAVGDLQVLLDCVLRPALQLLQRRLHLLRPQHLRVASRPCKVYVKTKTSMLCAIDM